MKLVRVSIYYAETERHVVISRILHGMRDQKPAYRKAK